MLIIDMPMPRSCVMCEVADQGFCEIKHESVMDLRGAYLDKRPDWCPIKGELPDEHGDLIDRDIMYKQIQLWKSTATDTITLGFLYHIEKLLMCIRPAIAAERKDDEQIH